MNAVQSRNCIQNFICTWFGKNPLGLTKKNTHIDEPELSGKIEKNIFMTIRFIPSKH